MTDKRSPVHRVQSVSVIVPMKDEADSIQLLLDALAAQTRLPDEIVLADGGSSDGTQEIVRAWAATSSIPTTVVEEPQGLPGRNRNVAVAAAEHDWIAAIDAGIHPSADWLQSLIETAEEQRDARVVFGRYAPLMETRFAEYAAITYVGPSDVDRRSIATCLVEKSAWQQIGGCPEDLRSSEDLLFFRRLDEHQIPVAYCRSTPVRWDLQPTMRKTFGRFAVYSQNSMRAGLFDDWQLRVTLQYAILATLLLVGLWWSKWLWLVAGGFVIARSLRRISVWHHSSSRRQRITAMLDPRTVIGVAAMNGLIDLAMFFGMGRWFISDVLMSSQGNRSMRTKSEVEVSEQVTT